MQTVLSLFVDDCYLCVFQRIYIFYYEFFPHWMLVRFTLMCCFYSSLTMRCLIHFKSVLSGLLVISSNDSFLSLRGHNSLVEQITLDSFCPDQGHAWPPFSTWYHFLCFVLLGFRISNATFNAIVMRHSDKDGYVRFDDFVSCYIKLKTLFGEYFAVHSNWNSLNLWF